MRRSDCPNASGLQTSTLLSPLEHSSVKTCESTVYEAKWEVPIYHTSDVLTASWEGLHSLCLSGRRHILED